MSSSVHSSAHFKVKFTQKGTIKVRDAKIIDDVFVSELFYRTYRHCRSRQDTAILMAAPVHDRCHCQRAASSSEN